MSEITFEEQVMQRVRNSIIDYVAKESYVKMDYGQRVTLPAGIIEKAWKTIDWDVVLKEVREQMQTRICNAIVGNMEAEIKTDVKNLLSVAGVREKLRIEVYPHLMKVLDNPLTQR